MPCFKGDTKMIYVESLNGRYIHISFIYIYTYIYIYMNIFICIYRQWNFDNWDIVGKKNEWDLL